MMMNSSSRLLFSLARQQQQGRHLAGLLCCSPPSTTTCTAARHLSSANLPLARSPSSKNQSDSAAILPAAAAAAAALLCSSAVAESKNEENPPTLIATVASCSVNSKNLGAEATMLSPATEPKTGILFPRLCNGMTFVGCGVRVKYGFVKVYAVGTYMDPLAMSVVKNQGEKEIKKALLDPNYPRTIRIVMNRGLSIDKYTAAIIEALEPRMKGQELNSLEEFKKLNPPVDLIEGAEMEMTIRGDTLLYKNAVGGIGQIKSGAFTSALCDVYYGNEAVSPGHMEDVLKGVQAL